MMQEARACDLPEDPARVSGQPLGQLGASLAVEQTLRVQEVGAIEDAAYHVPLRQAY